MTAMWEIQIQQIQSFSVLQGRRHARSALDLFSEEALPRNLKAEFFYPRVPENSSTPESLKALLPSGP